MPYRRKRRSRGGFRRRRGFRKFSESGAGRYEAATFSTSTTLGPNSEPDPNTPDAHVVFILCGGNSWSELETDDRIGEAIQKVGKGFKLAGIVYDVNAVIASSPISVSSSCYITTSHCLFIDRLDDQGVPISVPQWTPHVRSEFPVGVGAQNTEIIRPTRILHRREVLLYESLRTAAGPSSTVLSLYDHIGKQARDPAFVHNRVRLGHRLLTGSQALCLGVYARDSNPTEETFTEPAVHWRISGTLYYRWMT